jgi:hypothetical protein
MMHRYWYHIEHYNVMRDSTPVIKVYTIWPIFFHQSEKAYLRLRQQTGYILKISYSVYEDT